MKERVLQIGEKRRLAAILAEPDPSQLQDAAPCALLLNAGIVHRVGPFRLYVDLARSLAVNGYRSLRLDLSGLGDSVIRPGKLSAKERALVDGREACDWLQSHLGVERFVVMGLCSGAYNAHCLSLIEPRIAGAVFIDGIAFATRLHRWRILLRKLSPRFLRNAVKRRWWGLMPLGAADSAGARLAESEFFGAGLTQVQATAEVLQLQSQQLRMLFLYTGGNPDFSHPRQFREMFGITPDRQKLQVDYLPDAEHTLPLPASRRDAIDRIVAWYEGASLA